jgi:hypothetical protein
MDRTRGWADRSDKAGDKAAGHARVESGTTDGTNRPTQDLAVLDAIIFIISHPTPVAESSKSTQFAYFAPLV